MYSAICSLNYEDYFQLVATAKIRFIYVENEDEKMKAFRRRFLARKKYHWDIPQPKLIPKMYLVLHKRLSIAPKTPSIPPHFKIF